MVCCFVVSVLCFFWLEVVACFGVLFNVIFMSALVWMFYGGWFVALVRFGVYLRCVWIWCVDCLFVITMILVVLVVVCCWRVFVYGLYLLLVDVVLIVL